MAAMMRESDTGAADGASVDWTAAVGRLTVYQVQCVLRVAESARACVGQAPAALSAPADILPVLSASGGYAEFVDDVVHAAAAVAKIDADRLYDLPLDQAIDAVRQIAVAALERNADYLAGPVTAAIQRVAELAQAVNAGQAQP